jgi:hypothetical protein
MTHVVYTPRWMMWAWRLEWVEKVGMRSLNEQKAFRWWWGDLFGTYGIRSLGSRLLSRYSSICFLVSLFCLSQTANVCFISENWQKHSESVIAPAVSWYIFGKLCYPSSSSSSTVVFEKIWHHLGVMMPARLNNWEHLYRTKSTKW